MATSYKSTKSEKLEFSVLWILWFDDLQVTKIQQSQKLKEQEVDLSMLNEVWAYSDQLPVAWVFGVLFFCTMTWHKTKFPNFKMSRFRDLKILSFVSFYVSKLRD